MNPPATPKPHRRHTPSRPIMAIAAASVILGATFAACACASAADTTTAKATPAALSINAGPWSADPGWAGSAPGSWAPPRPGAEATPAASSMNAGPRSPGSGWAGFAPGSWAPAQSARTEYFHVVSTTPSGPGTIIITGVVDAGGTEHPGQTIDDATFAGGGFRIDHGSGHPSVSFNAQICVGTISQTGLFSVIDGTGQLSSLAGRGTYTFHALYTTARDASGCTTVMTSYIESIDGAVTLSPSAARDIKAASA
jgi:hypothetical protein